MHLLDLTLETPEENLALDEALLDVAEASGQTAEVLRLWELPQAVVVLGRSSQIALEVELAACRERQIPIARRASGGATIVAGPGSLMYAVVLSYAARPALRSLDQAHRFVLDTIIAGLSPLVAGIRRQGTSDLTLGELKFSGNSMRCRRNAFLYHGTLLYDFPLSLIGDCLKMPPRQPDYRHQRTHEEFITNLPLSAAALRAALRTAWQADDVLVEWPRDVVRELVATRYGQAEWNERR